MAKRSYRRGIDQGIWSGDGDPRHGTVNGYQNLKCDCADCRQAWKEYCYWRRMDRQNAIDPNDPRHGTDSYARNHLCLCEPCVAAKKEGSRIVYQNKLKRDAEKALKNSRLA